MEPNTINISTDSNTLLYSILGILATVGGSLFFGWWKNRQKKSTDIQNEVLKTEVETEKHRVLSEVKKEEAQELEEKIKIKEEELWRSDEFKPVVEQTKEQIKQFWDGVLKK